MVTKRTSTRRKPAKELARVKSENLRDYEIVYVIRPDIPEENIESIIEKINQLITSQGGEVLGTERWGKRKLAYPIKHHLEGYYVLSRFKTRPEASRDIEANLRISEEVLRFLVVKNK
jgi:small subunit ribosomal protein S6